jgi:hypothetical protein
MKTVKLGPVAAAAQAGNFRRDLAKNSPKKLSYDPSSKARNDRQHQGGVSRIVQLVLQLAPRKLHFLHLLAFGPVFSPCNSGHLFLKARDGLSYPNSPLHFTENALSNARWDAYLGSITALSYGCYR